MTRNLSASTCEFENGFNLSSSIFSNTEKNSDYSLSILNKGFIGLIFLLSSTSFSTELNVNPINFGNSPSTLSYQGALTDANSGQDVAILYGFLSNLINNSKPLEGKFAEYVNKDFWGLV